MTCTGFDAVVIDLTIKAEHCMRKYDKSMADVLNRMLEYHEDWEGEKLAAAL